MKKSHIFSIIAAICLTNSNAQNVDFSNKKEALKALAEAEATLGNPLSVDHNEEKFVELLKAISINDALSETDKMRPKLLLEEALKNHVGTKAHDIEYITPDDSTHYISESLSPLTLIYFNDPDCDACEMVKERLDTCSILKTMVKERKLEIIGIYTLNDEQSWRNTDFPDYIINGWNKNQEIEFKETYLLPTLPLFYLLDSDKKVLLKAEASLSKVLNYLQRETNK
ncbi:MAG: hypothetical protein Q4E41_02250 [Bacteroidales bacterium]|nr:hypothetical protein [Bacteroidales bacterium]